MHPLSGHGFSAAVAVKNDIPQSQPRSFPCFSLHLVLWETDYLYHAMLDIHLIRHAPCELVKMLIMRGTPSAEAQRISENLLDLDCQYRVALTQLQELQKQKNHYDRMGPHKENSSGASLTLDQKNTLAAQQQGILKTQIAQQEGIVSALQQKRHQELIALPNWLDQKVPHGNKEEDNKEVYRWAPQEVTHPFVPENYLDEGCNKVHYLDEGVSEIKDDYGPFDSVCDPWDMWQKEGVDLLPKSKEDFIRDHEWLGQYLGGMDFAQAARVSGSRFVYLLGDLARLERALSQWMLDCHTQRYGFTEMSVPYLVKTEAMYGSGQWPKFAQDAFSTTDERYLIPTGEVSLVNWVSGKILDEASLPLKLVSCTPCFRAEAGAAGRDTRGMLRHHQFTKVELVVICNAQESSLWHERMVRQGEWLLQQLALPYRRVTLCGGDIGASATKTYDIEVWFPAQGRYREIASCSKCAEYQSRRMDSRFRRKISGEKFYCHTLNGSGLPTGRTLAAILENHQQEDGSVTIPPVLWPYMGKKVLSRP